MLDSLGVKSYDDCNFQCKKVSFIFNVKYICLLVLYGLQSKSIDYLVEYWLPKALRIKCKILKIPTRPYGIWTQPNSSISSCANLSFD